MKVYVLDVKTEMVGTDTVRFKAEVQGFRNVCDIRLAPRRLARVAPSERRALVSGKGNLALASLRQTVSEHRQGERTTFTNVTGACLHNRGKAMRYARPWWGEAVVESADGREGTPGRRTLVSTSAASRLRQPSVPEQLA